MKVPFLDLSCQYRKLSAPINKEIAKVLSESRYILGPEVEAFERDFARYCGSKYAVGVNSGTDALFLALLSLGIGPGDEVITAANTYIATVLAITFTGARPVLVEMDPETYHLDVGRIERVVTSKTRVILPVHLYGQPVDMAAVLKVARKKNVKVIEDCAQAHGAVYNRRGVGTFGQAGCFSFYPGKNLGAYGDGGAVVTDNKKIRDKLLMLRNYGQKIKYHHLIKGYNSRLDTLQAAVLRVKLKHLDAWNTSRARTAALYKKYLSGLEDKIILPRSLPERTHVYHLYVVAFKGAFRDNIQNVLSAAGIQTLIHYPVPVHLQKAYRDLGYKRGDFPLTERYAHRILSLPMYPELTEQQVKYTAGVLKKFFQKN